MSHDLTNSQIALLSDIGEYDLSEFTGGQKGNLERLLTEAEPTESHPGSNFKLTAKGGGFLGKRGVSLANPAHSSSAQPSRSLCWRTRKEGRT